MNGRKESMHYERYCELKHDGFDPVNSVHIEPDDHVRLFKVPSNSYGISTMLILCKVSDPRYLTHCRVVSKSSYPEPWIRELYLAILKRIGDEGDQDAKEDAAEQVIVGEIQVLRHKMPAAAFEGTEFCLRLEEGEVEGESFDLV